MAGDYWIKFYTEIIDDPKMATLPDRLWRRFYELCLLAGKQNKDGFIPETKKIAWLLRMSESELSKDMEQLSDLDLIVEVEAGWIVKNFSKRQEKMSDAERSQKYRDDKKRDQYYEEQRHLTHHDCVTLSDECVTQITDNRIDNRTEQIQNASVPLNFSDSRPVIQSNYSQIWVKVTNQAGIPIREQPKVIEAIDILRPRFKSEDELINYLGPYFAHWCTQKSKSGQLFSRSNSAWLTEWAVAGNPLPGDKKPRERPNPKCPKCKGVGMVSSGVTDIHDKRFGSLVRCDCWKVVEVDHVDV